jgi:hypothetical protein
MYAISQDLPSNVSRFLWPAQRQRSGGALSALACIALGCACDIRLYCEQRLYLFYDLICGRIPKAICVNDLPTINIDAELTKPTFDSFYFNVLFFIQSGCHTGSHHLLDGSNCAVMYNDFLHGFTPFSALCKKEPISGWLPARKSSGFQ